MTRTKLWRLSLAAILGFGWLFLTPASYSDDPLSIAAQEIAELNEKVGKLNEEQATQDLIDIAESKYDAAVAAKTNRDNKIAAYDAAVQAEATALSEKTAAQNAVDTQTPIRNAAYQNKQTKQQNLTTAQLNYQTALINYPPSGEPGLNAWLYDCMTYWNVYNSSPTPGCDGAVPAAMGPWQTINFNFGGGGPAGLHDDYQIKWTGYIKQTQHWTPQFRTCSDDGMMIIINGLNVINNWYDRGGGCGAPNGFYMDSNEWVPIEVWWYENGGGANGSLQWNIGNGWQVVPSSVLSTTIPTKDQHLIDAENDLATAQSEYDQANQVYITENGKLEQYTQTLSVKVGVYNTAKSNTAAALTAKNNAVSTYDQAIVDMNDAIDDAWDSYNSTWQFEEQQRVAAAIAAAMANQPQPTPEPTIAPTPEPSPEPSPEQTQSVDPTPEPSSDTTDEPTPEPTVDPEPTVEPSPEPSPLPSDIDPEPTPEPKPTPAEPSEKPSRPNTITEETANLIADLTSKDTLTKLTPEQKAAVAEGLGIKSEELAKVAALAATEPTVAKALEEFGDRIKENAQAPMPYTLADATTEIATEAFLADPIGALTSIDLDKLFDISNWGSDMTDDQREKAQEVVIPVIIASNIVAAAMTRRV